MNTKSHNIAKITSKVEFNNFSSKDKNIVLQLL